jgi:hypothetical protein
VIRTRLASPDKFAFIGLQPIAEFCRDTVDRREAVGGINCRLHHAATNGIWMRVCHEHKRKLVVLY